MSDTKSVWKKYAAAALAVVSVVGFASCGSSNGAGSDDSATSELEQVKKNGEIVFGTEGTYAPFSYHDTDDNLTGYDVEIATAVAEELGVKAKSWKRIGIRCSRVWTRKSSIRLPTR